MKRTIVSLGMLMVVGCGQREVLRFVPAAPGYAVERPEEEEGSDTVVKAAQDKVVASARLGERVAASERALRHPAAQLAPTRSRAATPVVEEGSAAAAVEAAPPALVDLNTATLAELDALRQRHWPLDPSRPQAARDGQCGACGPRQTTSLKRTARLG